MKTYKYPNNTTWKSLSERPVIKQNTLDEIVSGILYEVKSSKDKAIINLTKRFDGVVQHAAM